ncbi:DUF4817 domain-containing protein [Trichonephila clavipes]|nr:DUF4817 domain-containing protein [Trichonephila clavipes]
MADRKRSDRASIVKTKVADVETALQRSPLKRSSIYLNIITEFISWLKGMNGMLGCSKTAQRVPHHGERFIAKDFAIYGNAFHVHLKTTAKTRRNSPKMTNDVENA